MFRKRVIDIEKNGQTIEILWVKRHEQFHEFQIRELGRSSSMTSTNAAKMTRE